MITATLVLAPEFGGAVFGPFPPGVVTLGSDPGCTLALHPSLGLNRQHAQLVVQADGRAVIQPAEANAVVLVMAGGRPPNRLRSAATLSPGDSFVLGGPDGPRFTLQVQTAQIQQSASGAAARPRGMNRLSADSLAAEARRQADVSLQTMGPFQEIRRAGFRLRSGALLQPRYVVSALVVIGGALFTGCGGIIAAIVAWGRHHG